MIESFLKNVLLGIDMGKKVLVIVCLILFLAVFSSSAMAIENDDDNPAADTTADTSTLSTPTSTVYNLAITLDWLDDESSKNTATVRDLSMAIIALNNHGRSVTDQISLLKGKGNLDAYCWPSGACNPVDTAYALLALGMLKEDIVKGLDWLNKTLVKDAINMKNWHFVLDSKSDGTCNIGFGDNMKPFTITDNKVNSKYDIPLSELGTIGKLDKLKYDCTGLGENSNLVTSLNYEDNNIYYIVGGSNAISDEILVPNTCFPKASNNVDCDDYSTIYTSWALAELGEDANDWGTYVHMEAEADITPANWIDNIFLTRYLWASKEGKNSELVADYFTDLITAVGVQDSSGRWDGAVYPTAVAAYTLALTSKVDAAQKGIEYIKTQWKPQGTWTNKVNDDAWVLIALYGVIDPGNHWGGNDGPGTSVEVICDDGLDNDLDYLTDCLDTIDCATAPYCMYCFNNQLDIGEVEVDCGGQYCKPCGGDLYPDPTPTGEPETGSFKCSDLIDNDGDTLIDCADIDCYLESVCDTAIPECTTDVDCATGKICVAGSCTPDDDDEGGSSVGIIILIIVIILIIGGGIFAFIKFRKKGSGGFSLFKKKPKGPTFEQFKQTRAMPSKPVARPGQATIMQPDRPVQQPKTYYSPKKNEEDELEASLRKAQKILHGK